MLLVNSIPVLRRHLPLRQRCGCAPAPSDRPPDRPRIASMSACSNERMCSGPEAHAGPAVRKSNRPRRSPSWGGVRWSGIPGTFLARASGNAVGLNCPSNSHASPAAPASRSSSIPRRRRCPRVLCGVPAQISPTPSKTFENRDLRVVVCRSPRRRLRVDRAAPNFTEELGREFSPDHAMCYLERLGPKARDIALRYIRSAPVDVDTPVRRVVSARWPVTVD